MIFRGPLLIACSLAFMATCATKSWSFNCEGRTVRGASGGLSCYCRNGSPAQTSDLVNFYCPQDRRPSRATPPPSTIPKDRSAKNARKANQDEAKAERRLAEAEKAERRTRRMLNEAKETKALAEKTLRDANKKVAALQKKVDATNDPAKKIGLLKEQLAIKKSMLPVVRGRDRMGRSISNYENKLRSAERTIARARAGLAQARQARVAAVTRRSPSSSFRSQSSKVKPVRNVEREVVTINKDTATAHPSNKRGIISARDKWRASQRKTLDLAAKWERAVKDGDTAKANALYADLQKAQATNKRYEGQFRKAKSSPANTDGLPRKVSPAQQRVTALEKNKQATPPATLAPKAASATATPRQSANGKEPSNPQTEVAEKPNQVPTTKFTIDQYGLRRPDWETATSTQKAAYTRAFEEQKAKALAAINEKDAQEHKQWQQETNRYNALIAGVRAGRDVGVGCLIGAVAGPAGCVAGAKTSAATGLAGYVVSDVARKVGGEGAGHAVDLGIIGLNAATGKPAGLMSAWDGIVMKGMDVYYNGFNY